MRRGGALLPTVVPTDSRALSCPPIGALPRNRLASSATGGASPISPPAGDRKGRPYGCVIDGAVGLFSLSLLHFSRFCGILGVFNLTLKEFSPWKP